MRDGSRLDGRTVILTRAPSDNERLARALRALGADVVQLPCVRTEPLEDTAALRAELADLRPSDLLVLTSRAAADAVTDCSLRIAAPVAVIGAATGARARARGLRVTFTAGRADGATLGRELPLPGGTVVLARADRATRDLPLALAARGATVREVVAYRTVSGAFGETGDAVRALERGGTVLVFASPSAVDGLLIAVGPALAARASVVATGAATAARVAERLGVEPLVVADRDPARVASAIARRTEEVVT